MSNDPAKPAYLDESRQRAMEQIKVFVKKMSWLADKALQDCVKALTEKDRQLAYGVILRDQYINEKEIEIDQLCLEFLVRQQPVAEPLRFAYATIKINLELERIGDYAEGIANNILRIIDRPIEEAHKDIIELTNLATSLLKDATKAYIDLDAALAQKSIEAGGAVDTLRLQVNQQFIKLFNEKKISFDDLEPLLSITRRFDRVIDQVRNICGEVKYIVTGEFTKHVGAHNFRILFMDKHNSCRSQIAEAIANSFKQPRFIFSSAGFEPRPIDEATRSFMAGKGFDLSLMQPKDITQIPNLEYYQVVIALTPEARRFFAKAHRKIVLIDWVMEDPSETVGPPERVQEAYEKAYQFIHLHLTELMQAVNRVNPKCE